MANPLFRRLPWLCILLLDMPFFSHAEQQKPQIVISSLDGTARVQRSGKKLWDMLAKGARIDDNDIVETFFQTKLTAEYGKGNFAVLGSNSKALFSISADPGGPAGSVIASFTLFSGGIFVKAVKTGHVSVFTTNGVVDVDSGSVSTIVESKTGETGYQIFSGSAMVRNIAQQKGRVMSSGQTTMIQPGREPTASLYLTNRHVAVLKHFFGDDYIANELKVSSITPTEETATSSQTRLSQSLSQASAGKKADEAMYRRLFNLDKIYEAIIRDQFNNQRYYEPIAYEPGANGKHMIEVGYCYDDALTGGLSYPEHCLTPSFSYAGFDAGLRLSIAKNATGKTGLYEFSNGLPGFLDLVDHVAVGNRRDSLFFRAGQIRDLSIGQGLVVNHFTNANPYKLFHPLGLVGQARIKGIYNFQAFVGDAATLAPAGAYVSVQPNSFFAGAGGYLDPSPYQKNTSADSDRFVRVADTLRDTTVSPFYCYEAALGADVFSNAEASLQVFAGISQNLSKDGGGFVLLAPDLVCSWQWMVFKAAYIFEKGRTMEDKFTWLSPVDATSIIKDSAMAVPRAAMLQNSLSPTRTMQGLHFSYGASPIKGCDLSLDFRQDLFGRQRDTLPAYGGRAYTVRAAVNDTLVPFLHSAEIFFRQTQTAFFYRDHYLLFGGMQLGVHAQTNPIVFSTAVQAGLDYIRIDNSEALLEWYAGISWGAL